jgi:hypothetical protein
MSGSYETILYKNSNRILSTEVAPCRRMVEADAAERLKLFRKAIEQAGLKLAEAKKQEASAAAEAEAARLDVEVKRQVAASAAEAAAVIERQSRKAAQKVRAEAMFKFSAQLGWAITWVYELVYHKDFHTF